MSLYLSDFQQRDYIDLCMKFQDNLRTAPDRKAALMYLKGRGFNWNIVDKFKIGWCPSDWNIRKELGSLKGRLIFPTIDEYGDVRGFSGRILVSKEETKDDEKRWWNEPYNKTFFLYGLEQALPNIIKKNNVIVVEGQTDVISCHMNGFDTVVGLMHDDLNIYQIAKLLRFTKNFILMLDGDKAGRKSTENIINKRFMKKDGQVSIRIPGKKQIQVFDVNLITNGEGYDPDSFLSKFGAEALRDRLKKSLKNK